MIRSEHLLIFLSERAESLVCELSIEATSLVAKKNHLWFYLA